VLFYAIKSWRVSFLLRNQKEKEKAQQNEAPSTQRRKQGYWRFLAALSVFFKKNISQK